MKKIEESISMKKSLTFKLVACAALLLFSILAVVGGVWAAQSVSINTTGNITFAATNVYAKVSGSTSGAQSNKTFSTLTFSSASVDGAPVSGDATTWTANNDLAFQTNGEDVVISVTVENLSTERELYVKLKDNLSSSSANLQKTVSPSVGAVQTLEASTGEGTSTVTYTITLHIKDQGKSVNGEFDYTFELVDGSQTKPEDDATPAAAEAYLLRDWQGAIRAVNSDFTGSKINSLSFTKGSLDGVSGISVAASTAEGTSAKTDDSVGEILAIVTEAGEKSIMVDMESEPAETMTYNVEIRSASDIYAPVNSTALLADPNIIDMVGGTPQFLDDSVSDMEFSAMLLNLSTISLSNLKTDNVTKMGGMFMGNGVWTGFNGSNIGVLDLSSWNTSGVTNMSYMFGMQSYSSINFGSISTANVTDMSAMFYTCICATSLNLSSFNTSNVTLMNSMFEECPSLTEITFGESFNTANVTNMNCMFKGCETLATLDVSNFNTANVTDMSDMFRNCKALTTLNVSNFNTENVTSMDEMFQNCSALQTLDLSNFVISGSLTQGGGSNGLVDGCSLLTTIVAPTNAIGSIKLSDDASWTDGETTYTQLSSATNGKTLTKVAG